MFKYAVVFVALFGLGLVFSAPADEATVSRKLIPLTGGKTRGASSGYYFGAEWATWAEAKEWCQQAGLTLLVIETKNKQSAFEEHLDGSLLSEMGVWQGVAWIAGTDKRTETGGTGIGRFYWSAAGSEKKAMNFYNFFSGTADPGSGCVAISNANSAATFGKWYAVSCTAKAMYFCETKN